MARQNGIGVGEVIGGARSRVVGARSRVVGGGGGRWIGVVEEGIVGVEAYYLECRG